MTPTKSAGQLAYERDIARFPRYHDGGLRPTWESLDRHAKPTWERNPTTWWEDAEAQKAQQAAV